MKPTDVVVLGALHLNARDFPMIGNRICRTESDIERILPSVSTNTIWITTDRNAADLFLRGAIGNLQAARGCLLALKSPRAECIPSLQTFFHPIVGIGGAFHFLPNNELFDVLVSSKDDAHDLFIGGTIDLPRRSLTLIRGDLRQIVVPLSAFPSTGAESPDFSRFSVTDFGGTIAFGKYEASNHSILYEFDSDYRCRYRKRREAEDRTFGASLRRLRRIRGLTQADFTPISAKEIARIEQDQVKAPHAKTISLIAKKLGVSPEEIETY